MLKMTKKGGGGQDATQSPAFHGDDGSGTSAKGKGGETVATFNSRRRKPPAKLDYKTEQFAS